MNKAAAGVVSRVAGLIKYMSTDCTELPSPLFKQNIHPLYNVSNKNSEMSVLPVFFLTKMKN